jgi:hypothetical protein
MAQTHPKTAAITCPNCGRRFAAPVHPIIDVGQNPAGKTQLLQGQINVAVCPQCGAGGILSLPFLYHDPQKELLFVYTPPSTVMDNNQQQRFIGSLLNTVMSSLSPGQRKGYLFQPRNFLSLETMQDEIVIADGISRQELESQKRQLRLLERLMNATSDEVIGIIAQENEKDLNKGFFLLLRGIIEQMRDQGDADEATRIETLRHKLLQYSDAAREGDLESTQIISQDELLQRLLETDDEQQQKSLVAAARPLLDYGFFQALTATIEEAHQAGKAEKADRLVQLRSKLLAWTDELDAKAKEVWKQKAKLIQKILQSPDWRAALEPHWQEIDPIFLSILSSNIELTQQQGDTQTTMMLQQFADLALVIAREHAPPEVQLLNQLLEAEYPAGTQRVLEKNRDRLNADLLRLIDRVIRDMAAQGFQHDVKIARLIQTQVQEMIGA